MAQIWGNNAISTLAASLASGDTTVFIQPAHGARFPVVAAPDTCYCTLEDAAGVIEIVKVTAHTAAASSLTVVRAQQGTAAAAFIIGDICELRLTAAELSAFETDIDTLYATKANKAGDTYTGTHDFSGATAVALPAATSIGTVSAIEISYLDGVTSSIQTQLNAKGDVGGEVWGGVHDFTGTSLVGLPANTFIGLVTPSQISYLDGVTSSIQGQLNNLLATKAAKAGETYSGTHNFTGAVIQVPTLAVGTNTADAASMAALQQAVFASFANLPADPGDPVLRVLTTFSGYKDWQVPPASDVAQYLAGIH